MIWTAGMVPSNMEMICAEELKENGYAAFVPLGKRLTKPTRKRKPVLTTFKLFPGYVFVQIETGSNFQSIRLKRVKINLLFTYDKEGAVIVSEIKPDVIRDLLVRSDLGDLFVDYEKKNLRKSFDKNQLVCWQKNGAYSLGFVSHNTQGKSIASIKIAGGLEAKIPVDLIALL